jgi:DNA-binding transcriptional LysR family regulator
MELRHLRYFVAVAELENVSKAAVKLHVSQPALSRQIRDLEDELGLPLLARSAKSVRLTAAGRVFLDEAKAVLQRADAAVQSVRAVARGERGEIHVGYAPTPTVELLPCALHAFQNLAPDVRVTLHDLSSEEMLRGLSEAKLHVCLMVEPSARSLRGLKFERLHEYPICVALRPAHPLAKSSKLKLAQIAGEPFVGYTRADYPDYHDLMEELFRPLGRQARIVEEHDSGPGLIAATAVGRGLAIVPSCMAMLAGNRLKLRPIDPPPAPLRVGAAFDPKRITPAGEKFLAASRQPPK